VSGGIFVVDVLKHQHFPELFFCALRETAALSELGRVFVGAKQTIPQRDVPEIVLVHVVLVMDGMELGGLNEEAQPFGRPDVGVIEAG
jgi:hypothetical protein